VTEMCDERPTALPPPAEDYYRRLCDSAALALIATDAEFRIVLWNDAAAALLEARREEMLGRPITEAVPPGRMKLFERLLRRTTERGETTQFEVKVTGRSGRERQLVVVLSPVPGPSGRAQGVAAWVMDETHRKQLAEKLTQAERMAALGTLAGGVAHHFNNILGGVATFVDFALTSGDLTAMKRALQMTAEAASRASKITHSLLSFAKKDIRRTDLADLTEVVMTFSHLVERPLAEHGIRLQLDLRPVPIIPVEANRMHQALGNLLTNAEEAMPNGGTISIRVDRVEHNVVLSFADTGAGIRPEDLPHVFEPFFTTKGVTKGGDRSNPGLGLSVVHGIIMEMGGRIEARSEPGRGAEFLISFPIPDEEPA